MSVTIRETTSGAVLAEGEPGESALKFEGNWYFAPDAVKAEHLQVTKRTYTCPYKGECHWVDFVAEGRVVPDVAWVYPDPKPGHETIKGRFGFYAGSRGSTREE